MAAFDPGKVNFAFLIEEIDTVQLSQLVCPPKRDRFAKTDPSDKKSVEPTTGYLDFLERFYHCGRTVLCVNSDITKDESTPLPKKKKAAKGKKVAKEEEKEEKVAKEEKKITKGKGSKALDQYVFLRLTALLDRHREHFDRCSTIIIEQQMSFGTRVNTMAIKIAQHTYSYFLFRYGDTKRIVEFPSYNKTQLLGAPMGLAKPMRKKWAVVKADEIWTLRGDMDTAEQVGSTRKKDDMSDCLLHVLAYLISETFG